jgi:hypothetical protein
MKTPVEFVPGRGLTFGVLGPVSRAALYRKLQEQSCHPFDVIGLLGVASRKKNYS